MNNILLLLVRAGKFWYLLAPAPSAIRTNNSRLCDDATSNQFYQHRSLRLEPSHTPLKNFVLLFDDESEKKTYEEVRAPHNNLNQSRRRRRSYKRKVASIAVVRILSRFQVFLDVVPFPSASKNCHQ